MDLDNHFTCNLCVERSVVSPAVPFDALISSTKLRLPFIFQFNAPAPAPLEKEIK